MATPLGLKILEYLEKHDTVNSLDLANLLNEDHQKIIGSIKSLETINDLIETKPVSQKKWDLTEEGKYIVEHGSHEAVIYNAVPQDGIAQQELMTKSPYAKVGFSKALAMGWIELDKSGAKPIVRRKVTSITDITQSNLKNIDSIPNDLKGDYKKRKLLQEINIKSTLVGKGTNFSTKIEKLEADLTSDLLVNNTWKQKKFKPYNFDALGVALEVGHLHPLLKVRSEFRKIFLEMGFTEMPTNNFVESSFWNFDALFQPQQHPARDAHDTFFISEPKTSSDFPKDYVEKVKKIHSEGGYGSQGYRYNWKLEEAEKNLLRTHTTAVSARMLYNLMQEGSFRPVKYFSIDRVFRNETLDATHLAEFHQVEGVVADHNLTLGHLIGTLYEFFKKLGITQLKFKPAYNPYTEPSMEIFCYHDGLGKWIEIGNSGMFRPEMLLPMGLPEDVNVIAWGLSLERPTMIKYGINNIRDLVGPKVDLEMVYNNPICRLDKVTRMDNVLKTRIVQNGDAKKNENDQFRDRNLIIFCDPSYPMYSLEILLSLIKPHINVDVNVHVHSSVSELPNELIDFCSHFQNPQEETQIVFSLIWKKVGMDPIIKLPGILEIIGEVNILRYINRLIETINPDVLKYETLGPVRANKIDSCLEQIHSILYKGDVTSLNVHGKQTLYVVGDQISIVDIIIDSIRKRKVKKKSK